MSGISAVGYGYNWYPAARSYANASYANAGAYANSHSRMSGAFRRIAYSPVSRVPAVSLNLAAQAPTATQAPAQAQSAAQAQNVAQAPIGTQAQSAAQRPLGTQAPNAVSAASFPVRALPTAADLNNASEWMVRMRIQYPAAANAEMPAAVGAGMPGAVNPESAAIGAGMPGAVNPESAAVGVGMSGAVNVPPSADVLDGRKDPESADLEGMEGPQSPAEVMKEAECQTCAKRRYQDGSDDPGVSFKTPTRMNPDQAATAVRAHEQEHVVREQAKAQREGREVVSQSVSLHTEICPECGRVYIAGGVTHTVTVAEQSDQAEQPDPQEGLSLENAAPLSNAA